MFFRDLFLWIWFWYIVSVSSFRFVYVTVQLARETAFVGFPYYFLLVYDIFVLGAMIRIECSWNDCGYVLICYLCIVLVWFALFLFVAWHFCIVPCYVLLCWFVWLYSAYLVFEWFLRVFFSSIQCSFFCGLAYAVLFELSLLRFLMYRLLYNFILH